MDRRERLNNLTTQLHLHMYIHQYIYISYIFLPVMRVFIIYIYIYVCVFYVLTYVATAGFRQHDMELYNIPINHRQLISSA